MFSPLYKLDATACDSDDREQFHVVVHNTFVNVVDTFAAAGVHSMLRRRRSDSFLYGRGAMKVSTLLGPSSEGSELNDMDDMSISASSCSAYQRSASKGSSSTMTEDDRSTELSSEDQQSCGEEDDVASSKDLPAAPGYTLGPMAASSDDDDSMAQENQMLARENAALREKVWHMENSKESPSAPMAGLPTHGDFAGCIPGQACGYVSVWMPMEVACMNTTWIGGNDHTKAHSEVFGAQVSGIGHACPSPEDSRTTVMLRNLPNNYTRDMLVELLQREGFGGAYNFLYLPIDFKTQGALGYAFIDMAHPSFVQRFWSVFDGFSDWTVPSRKECYVAWCEPNQGLRTHIEKYRNSPVMHSSVPDEYKPLLLQDGQRVHFPPPTKAIRAPRFRDCRRR